MKSKKKTKRVKPRIKVAPPSKRHKSVKDYDRKKSQEEAKKLLNELSQTPEEFKQSILSVWPTPNVTLDKCDCKTLNTGLDEEDAPQSWVNSFFAIFGFKRKI